MMSKPVAADGPKPKKSQLSQQDVPAYSLKETLRLAQALSDELAKKPSSPLQVAAAINLQPTTAKFRMLASASSAYGLTEGSAWAEKISLTPLGRRSVSPTTEGDDALAQREALMRPRVEREFLTHYSGSKWPREDIGRNVLEEMGVPTDQTSRALNLIHENANAHGLLTLISGAEFVNLEKGTASVPAHIDDEAILEDEVLVPAAGLETGTSELTAPAPPSQPDKDNKRVFITHGKKRDIVQQMKVLLEYGEFEPVVAMDKQAGAVTLSDKVIDEMRACSAAIIHVNVENKLIDAEGQEHQKLNDNVLIEIGAALALYGHNFILLVESGAKLPSNLDGLYQVRYSGEGLDHESTMALLKAFAGFRQSA
jgi:predicted nucleotide-binding protein